MASGKCFEDLPDELLLEIFSNLNTEDLAMSVRHVNSHWKEVSQDNVLWKNRTFSPGDKMTDEEIATHLMNMPALRSFSPSRGTNTKVIIDTICKYCRDIRHIELKPFHRLSNSKLQQILKTHPHIENLTIPLPNELHQAGYAKLIGQFQKLTTLSFGDRYVETAGGILKVIAEGCPSLLHFDLGRSSFDDQEVQFFLERKGQQLLSFSVRCHISTVTHKLLAECCNLEQLDYENWNEDLPDTYVQHVSKLSKLRSLTLKYFKEGQTRTVSNIFVRQSLYNLIKVSIGCCDGFDATGLTMILRNCPQLQFLIVRGLDLSDDGFQHISSCKNLEFLDAGCCSSITDKSMEYVGSGCPNLKHLDIGNCSGLTNKSIDYVCTGCQKLNYLDIQQCPEMTDAVLESIFRSKELDVLNLMWNTSLLGIHFHMIPSHLVHLVELNIAGLSIDKQCLDKLKGEMPHLKIIGYYSHIEEPDIELGDATFFISQLL